MGEIIAPKEITVTTAREQARAKLLIRQRQKALTEAVALGQSVTPEWRAWWADVRRVANDELAQIPDEPTMLVDA